MSNAKLTSLSVAAAVLLSTVGCQDLPGTRRQQGAVVGGAGGAVAGAVIGGERHRWLGALIGGALGATGGYLIGAQTEKVNSNDRDGALESNRRAETQPATAEEAKAATTADVNKDGFVTLDEVVAMERAGLSDDEILSRLDATDQIFELTPEQRRYLTDRGVSRTVMDRLPEMNREQRENIRRTDVISEPAP
jgi:hypothetical protein